MTADPTALRALADEVERLTGPSREMDARIIKALGWCWKSIPAILHTEAWRPGGSECLASDLPRPTHSIDAAASLMPEGWSAVVVLNADPAFCGVTAYAPTAPDHDPESDRNEPQEGQAGTEPLARTAVALRALAAIAEGENDAER